MTIQDCFRTILLQQAKLCVTCKNKAVLNTASHTLEHFMNQETAWNSTATFHQKRQPCCVCQPATIQILEIKLIIIIKINLKKTHDVEHYMRMTMKTQYKSVLNEGKKEKVQRPAMQQSGPFMGHTLTIIRKSPQNSRMNQRTSDAKPATDPPHINKAYIPKE